LTRHNGNILIASTGHLIHIDFGFILSTAPGGAFAFENAPFKLTQEYVTLMGGIGSSMYEYFKILLIQGFIALRKYVDDLCDIVDIMSRESTLPCYDKFNLKEFRERFKPNLLDSERAKWVEDMVKMSLNSKRTQWYDEYQKMFTGIEP
jgi:phosphatidylinositol kinase/protein kinase (PI-3  family)